MDKGDAKVNVLISQDEINERLDSLAKEIATDVTGEVMVVSLLKGSFMFTADLIRALHNNGVKAQVDFITLSSYGKGMSSSGTITVNRDLSEDVTGKTVLIVDDILESGRTIDFARRLVTGCGAKDVKVAVLLHKPNKLAVEIAADYVGFTIPDEFVVGYGLDYANYYRELPFVGVMVAGEDAA